LQEKAVQLIQAREAMCEYGRRLWQRGFVAANDGNLSCRIDEERILTTPTGVSKGFMRPDDLILCDLAGRVISGAGRPSSELKMHLAVYQARTDIRAVVHAHPPVATAFALAGVPLEQCLLPESVLSLGAIPIAPYGTPSTDEIPRGLAPFIPRCDAVLLANHGAVTWAATLEAAYFRMETLEHTACITLNARLLGDPRPLSPSDVAKLEQVRERMGIAGPSLPCSTGACAVPAPDSVSDPDGDLVERVERIVRQVLAERVLSGEK
jgi:L-fuculose-phosphate aldolase